MSCIYIAYRVSVSFEKVSFLCDFSVKKEKISFTQ